MNNVKHKEILDSMVEKGMIKKIEESWAGWTPDLTPKPDTPFYRWPALAEMSVPSRIQLAAR